jgi:hypothetical protein
MRSSGTGGNRTGTGLLQSCPPGPGGGVAPAPSSYILRGPSRKACEGAVDLDERLRRSLFLKDYGATGLSMVGVAQLVEPRVVIPVVVGSSPIVHPIFLMGR